MIDPANNAEYSFFFDVIKGAHAYRTGAGQGPLHRGHHRGERSTSCACSSTSPAAHFLKLLTHISFLPLHPSLLKSTGWANASTVIGNGPVRHEEPHGPRRSCLEKNPYYWDADNVAMDRLRIRFMDDANDATDGYITGQIQWVTRSLINGDKLQPTDKIEVYPMFGTTYFFFACDQPVWSDWRVRRGLALLVPWDQVRNKDDFSFPSELVVPSIPELPHGEGNRRPSRWRRPRNSSRRRGTPTARAFHRSW